MNNKLKGTLFGVVAAVAYGTNPLFSLPLYALCMTPDSVLFYRYGIGGALLGLILKLRGESLRLKKHEVLPLFLLGLLFSSSSFLLFKSFLYMDAGVASTILFVYPVLVALIMAVVFKEKASWITYGCIGLALCGIGLLYKGDGESGLDVVGMTLVLLSALTYAIYIIIVGRIASLKLPVGKMSFWVIVFGMTVFVVSTKFLTQLQPVPPTLSGWVNVCGEAIVPTVISVLFINISIKAIGSTYAAIIGALEPVTALMIGVFVFGESFTLRIAVGALLIVFAVILVVSQNVVVTGLKKGWHKLR